MDPGEPIFVVFNPMSGKGRGGRLVAPVLEALSGGPDMDHGLTQKAGDEERVTEQALHRGFRRIVAVGGDGTWSNVGNAIVKSGVDASLGLVAGGTGCDLAKSLAIPARDVSAAAATIKGGNSRLIDIGKVEGRYFLNIAGFGFDIAVIEDSWKVRWLGGDLLYLYCALRQLYSYRGFPVEMSVDGGPAVSRDLMMLVIANARIFGGGFKIAPGADLADGLLDAVAISNLPFARRLPIMLRVMRGTHGGSPDVSMAVGREVRLRFREPPAYETDGEWRRARSAELLVETAASAIRVLVPAAG
jgi:diacylglycerol kinase (ATP)